MLSTAGASTCHVSSTSYSPLESFWAGGRGCLNGILWHLQYLLCHPFSYTTELGFSNSRCWRNAELALEEKLLSKKLDKLEFDGAFITKVYVMLAVCEAGTTYLEFDG